SFPLISNDYFHLSSHSDSFNVAASLSSTHVMPGLCAVYVQLTFSPPLPDDTTVILNPSRFVLSKHSVLAPHVLATVRSNSCFLPVFNLLSGAQSLPERLRVASVEVLPVTASVCSVQASAPVSSSFSKAGNLPFRIDSSLTEDYRGQLLSLLNSFSHIFDSNN